MTRPRFEDDDSPRRPRRTAHRRARRAGVPVGLILGAVAAVAVLLGGAGLAVYWFVVRDAPGPGAGDPAAAGRPTGPPPGWQPFRPPGAGFKVYIPGPPGIVLADGPSRRYVSYGDNVSCTIRVEAAPPDQLAQKLTELIFQQPHWKADPDRRPVTLAGRAAVQVESDQMPNTKYKRAPPITVARYLTTANAVYVVMIEGRPEVVTDRMQAAFFDSFELTD